MGQNAGTMTGLPVRQRVSPELRPRNKKIMRRPEEQKERFPVRFGSSPKEGHAAAMEEYQDFKAAGMLAQWRERWKYLLKVNL